MEYIISQIQDQVGYLLLNRPEKYNSFNTQMLHELKAGLETFIQDEAVRCIVIKGQGKGFCAGQDLGEFPNPTDIDFAKVISENYNPLIQTIYHSPKPVIAGVNGVAAGAGASLALACDITIASESASFTQAFSKISLIPDSGATYFLPRSIGWQKAAAIMFTGDKITAQEAEKMGMIYKSVPADSWETTLDTFAKNLAQMPTAAIHFTKQLLQASAHNTLDAQLQQEQLFQVKAGHLDDYKEGVQAFLEKRPANFQGH
jgi:2-(1,2-epoxy-1,2-dihydrophenyl)acetyl-CoA isomerase